MFPNFTSYCIDKSSKAPKLFAREQALDECLERGHLLHMQLILAVYVLLEKAVVTDTAIAAEKATEKALKSILPKWQDRVTAKLLIRSININVLKPILEEKPNKLAKMFDDSVELFGITMIPLEQLVLKNNRDNLQSIMNSERAFYQEGTKSLYRREGWISETNLDQIREIISISKTTL